MKYFPCFPNFPLSLKKSTLGNCKMNFQIETKTIDNYLFNISNMNKGFVYIKSKNFQYAWSKHEFNFNVFSLISLISIYCKKSRAHNYHVGIDFSPLLVIICSVIILCRCLGYFEQWCSSSWLGLNSSHPQMSY